MVFPFHLGAGVDRAACRCDIFLRGVGQEEDGAPDSGGSVCQRERVDFFVRLDAEFDDVIHGVGAEDAVDGEFFSVRVDDDSPLCSFEEAVV